MTQTTEKPTIHTVFGAGQVGRRLADELLARGIEVRIVRRGEPGPAKPGLTWLRGDITDAAFAEGAAEGAEVVYNCTNPAAYHKWDQLLPPLYRAVADAAQHAGARLVTLDNVYMYGDRGGAPMTEGSEMSARTKKGMLRAELYAELRARADRGDFHLTTGRASDFFGPEASFGAIFSDRSYERLAAGKPVEVMGNPDFIHSYSFIPDVARGLAILGTQPTADGGIFHLPVSWQGTTRELLDGISAELGHPKAKVRRLPSWFLSAAGTFVPLLAAVAEMTYQWENDFVVDDSRFRETFGEAATPADDAVRTTAAWAKSRVVEEAA
jgi:nucleoside-diphosphate-sugar epimerase